MRKYKIPILSFGVPIDMKDEGMGFRADCD